MLAIRIPDWIKEFADVWDCRCKMRWVVDCLFVLFSGSLIHLAVVISPGCNEFVDSTTASSYLYVGLKAVRTNSAIIV